MPADYPEGKTDPDADEKPTEPGRAARDLSPAELIQQEGEVPPKPSTPPVTSPAPPKPTNP